MTDHAVFNEVTPLCRGLKYFWFFTYRDTFSIRHPNTTNIKFAALLKVAMWISLFFLWYSHRVWKVYLLPYSIPSFFIYEFSSCRALALSHSRSVQTGTWFQWWWEMNLHSWGLFLITAVHQSLVGPWTYRKEQNAPAEDKAGRTLGVLVSLSLKINLIFLICICVIRHN